MIRRVFVIFQEEISKLLRFESSAKNPGEKISLTEYISGMKAGDREIFYLSAPRSVCSYPLLNPLMLKSSHRNCRLDLSYL